MDIIINLNYEFLLIIIIIDFLMGSETRRQESSKVNNGSSATFDTTRACTGFSAPINFHLQTTNSKTTTYETTSHSCYSMYHLL
jgi:hypothetical protein